MRNLKLSVNIVLVALMVLSFLASYIATDLAIWEQFFFRTDKAASQPWSILTYPFATAPSGGGAWVLLFMSLWLFQVGTQVEMDMKPRRYAIAFAVFTIVGALTTLLGSEIVGREGALMGPAVPVACVTILWATRAPTATVALYGVLPIQAKWLAVISCAIILFGLHPSLAIFSALTFVLAWAFGDNRLPIKYISLRKDSVTDRYRKHPKEDESYFSDVKRREKEREERERLRKLFEASAFDDKDK
jgi:membrane associated rhomboid family serine protease